MERGAMAKILLVEDDKNIVENLSAVLGAEGFQVKTASGQKEALEAVEQESFDLLLLDVSLKDGNGFAVCSAVKGKGDLPVIFLTASGLEEDVVSAMDGIIRRVASYRNYRNAIGFSFRFYASEMAANRQIKLLALEGVAPTKESIRDGSYPIASSFYAVTASPIGEPAPEETDGDLAAFLAWIRSPEGQELVEKTGYVGVGQEELR